MDASTHYHNSLARLIAEAEAIRQARFEERCHCIGREALPARRAKADKVGSCAPRRRTGRPVSATRRAAEDTGRGRREVLTMLGIACDHAPARPVSWAVSRTREL